MIIFLSIFGTGGQATQAMNDGFGIIIIFVPVILTIYIGYKIFKND